MYQNKNQRHHEKARDFIRAGTDSGMIAAALRASYSPASGSRQPSGLPVMSALDPGQTSQSKP